MLFVFSAPLRLAAKPAGKCVARSQPRLGSHVKALISELKNLEANSIKKQLHVNDTLAKAYEKNLATIESTHPAPACALFDSNFYSALDMASYTPDDADWAHEYVRILSGFYGILRPYDSIHTGSLPVTLSTKLSTSRGKNLRAFWKDAILKELSEDLRACPMPVIIDCTTEEDKEIFELDKLPQGTSIHSVEFKVGDNKLNLEAQGEFVRWALENRCMTIQELVEYRGYVNDDDPATFQLNASASKDNLMVFEEAGSNQKSWSRQLKDSGLSKGAFMKEVAGGKNRYKREELKKALGKDRRKEQKRQPKIC
mmetsp:Transcript_16323/g.37664  ORF Transcript_16323/g.37664 Transcript_16323/m.37664 type:complete len:312 (+) Transcript_16323:27-962(+)